MKTLPGRTSLDQLLALRAFGRVVEAGSFTRAAAVYEKPSVAVDPLFFAGLNGTLELMVQQERQHRLSRLAIV